MNSTVELIYVHDPMCSWCWGYQPILPEVISAVVNEVPVRRLLGGLAPDSDVPMPAAQQQAIQGYWRRIEQELGRPFNYDFWKLNTPRRSTYPACRAVLAAAEQQAEVAMIDAIQQAYYQRAMNPSNLEVLCQLAAELGLDEAQFRESISSQKVVDKFSEELLEVQRLPVQGFPTWVFRAGSDAVALPLDYHSAEPTISAVRTLLQAPAVRRHRS